MPEDNGRSCAGRLPLIVVWAHPSSAHSDELIAPELESLFRLQPRLVPFREQARIPRATDSVQQTTCNRQRATDSVQQTMCNRQRATDSVQQTTRPRGIQPAAVAGCRSGKQAQAPIGPQACVGRSGTSASAACVVWRGTAMWRAAQHTTCDNMRQHATACGVHAATGMGLSAARRDEYADAHAATHTRTQKGIVLLRCSVLQFLPAWRAGHAAGVLAGALHKLRRGAKCPAAQSPADYLCAAVAQLALGVLPRLGAARTLIGLYAANGSALHAKLVEASRTGLHAAAA